MNAVPHFFSSVKVPIMSYSKNDYKKFYMAGFLHPDCPVGMLRKSRDQLRAGTANPEMLRSWARRANALHREGYADCPTYDVYKSLERLMPNKPMAKKTSTAGTKRKAVNTAIANLAPSATGKRLRRVPAAMQNFVVGSNVGKVSLATGRKATGKKKRPRSTGGTARRRQSSRPKKSRYSNSNYVTGF